MKYTIIDYLLSMTNCFSCGNILSANFFIDDFQAFQSKYNNGNLEIFRKRFKKNYCICIDKLNKVFYTNIEFDKIAIQHICKCKLFLCSSYSNRLASNHLSQINCLRFEKSFNNSYFKYYSKNLYLYIKNANDQIIIKDIDFEDAKAKAKQFEQNQIFY